MAHASEALDDHARDAELKNAKAILTEYIGYIKGEALIAHMDQNPWKVKVDLKVLDFIGHDSSRGRKAMIAAGDQNRAFNFGEILYFNQGTENTGWLNEAMVASAAASIPGLNVPKLLADRNSSAVAKAASAFDAEAVKAKVQSTPTILVGRGTATPTVVSLQSPTDKATLVAALDTALAG